MHDGSSRDEGRRAGAVPRDVPIAATAVYGQSGSDARATECFVGVGTGTPDGANGNFRHISYSGSVFCPNGNAANRVTIHITEVTLRDTSDTRILAAAPQYGPYVIANDGGTTGGSYNRISDTQSQFIKIQAYLEITSGTTGSSNGWHARPPAVHEAQPLQGPLRLQLRRVHVRADGGPRRLDRRGRRRRVRRRDAALGADGARRRRGRERARR